MPGHEDCARWKREWPLALAGFTVLALVLVHPVLRAPTSLALGHPEVDVYNHIWGFWHVGDAILHGNSPFAVSVLNWPEGGDLYFIDFFNAIWTLPVGALLGPVAAYNLAVFGNLVLAGWAGWALARSVCGSGIAAVVAGVATLTAPSLWGQVHNGITETLSVGWLSLAALALWRLWERPCRRRALHLGVALGICGLANWYYGVFAGLLLVPVLLFLVFGRQPRRQKRLVRLLFESLAVATALVALPAWRFLKSLSGPEALVQRQPAFVEETLAGHNMVDLFSFFRPGDVQSPDLWALFDTRLLAVVYLGWVLLVVAAVAWRSDRRARIWAAGALVGFALSLGAWLYVGGRYLQLPGGGRLGLPFLALWREIPVFAPISHAFRFSVLTTLCLATMASLAVRPIAQRTGLSPRRVVGLLSVAIVAENLLLSPAPFPAPVTSVEVPAVYDAIEEEGAVLDLPISLQVLSRGRYGLYQIHHGRPIPYALEDPTPTSLEENALGKMVLLLERSSVDTVPPRLPVLDLALARSELQRDGYAAVVVHAWAYPPRVRDRVVALLDIALGEGTWVGDAVFYSVD